MLPFTLLFTLPFTLPLTVLALSSSFFVRVGSSGSKRSFMISSGIDQKKIAPSDPTETIVFWSGDIFVLMIDPECP